MCIINGDSVQFPKRQFGCCNIKRSRVNAYLRSMNDIVQVDPLSVGSNKKTINVFRWNN